MVLNPADPNSIPDYDNSTDHAATTPPETAYDDPFDDPLDDLGGPHLSSSSVPWPGSTFIIRVASSGHVITLLDGQIVLAPPGSRGCIHWACVETKGWLGFQSPVSGRFLGHDKGGRLCCSAKNHLGWEYFCVRMRPDGGYVLLMTHFDWLWPVGVNEEQGVEKLAKVANDASEGIVWEFVKI